MLVNFGPPSKRDSGENAAMKSTDEATIKVITVYESAITARSLYRQV